MANLTHIIYVKYLTFIPHSDLARPLVSCCELTYGFASIFFSFCFLSRKVSLFDFLLKYQLCNSEVIIENRLEKVVDAFKNCVLEIKSKF